MRPNAGAYFTLLLCLTPDDFIRQGDSPCVVTSKSA
jgi:hypothetical protein